MPWVLGIDPSSKKLAICLTQSLSRREQPDLHKISLPEGVYRATGAAFSEAFLFFQDFTNLDAVTYMEAPVVGRSVYSSIVQAQVGGAVMAAACKAGMKLHLVNVSTWKKEVVGKGNAQKPEIAAWLKKYWYEAYTPAAGDQDLIDACGVNRYGVQNQRLMQAILSRSNGARKKVESKKDGQAAARRGNKRAA